VFYLVFIDDDESVVDEEEKDDYILNLPVFYLVFIDDDDDVVVDEEEKDDYFNSLGWSSDEEEEPGTSDARRPKQQPFTGKFINLNDEVEEVINGHLYYSWPKICF